MRHGTRYGYDRHRQSGEPPCPDCQDANRRHNAAYWRRHHPKPHTLVDHIVDVVDAHDPVALTELAALIPDAKPETLRRTVYRLIGQGRIRRMDRTPLTIGRT